MPAERTSDSNPFQGLAPDGAAMSRRAALRGLMSAASALVAAGCTTMAATPPEPDVSSAVGGPSASTVLVATTRKPVNDGRARPWFGPDRARGMAVTLARAHLGQGGAIPGWFITSLDPARRLVDMVGPATRDVMVYVHGFNQTFEQSVFTAGRLAAGIQFTGEALVFAWPSRASLLDYNYDRESANLSRDALVQVLEELLACPSVGRVNIVAHSVGTVLTTEAMQRLYAKRGAYAADRVGAIVLASPDIDMNVFTAAIPQMGPLVAKITVVTAIDDRALAVSQIVNGGTVRVGAAQKEQIEKLGVLVIDASLQGWGVLNHDLFLTNAGVRKSIHDAFGECRGFWGCGSLTPAQR